MKLEQIQEELSKKLNNKPLGYNIPRQIIIWNDLEADYKFEDISKLKLLDTNVLEIRDNNRFTIKYQIERLKPNDNFLLYSQSEQDIEFNPLLDIENYAQIFYADKVEVWLEELGLNLYRPDKEEIKSFIKDKQKLFNSSERRINYKKLIDPSSSIKQLELSILALLTKAHKSQIENIMLNLLSEGIADTNKYLQDITKYQYSDLLWELIAKHYGYHSSKPNLESLACYLLETYIIELWSADLPSKWLQKNKLENLQKQNILLLVNHWKNLNKTSIHETARILEEEIIEDLDLNQYCTNASDYVSCDVLRYFDLKVIEETQDLLLNHFKNSQKLNLKELKGWINTRQSTNLYESFKNSYQALLSAIALLEFDINFKSITDLDKEKALDVFKKYSKEFYKIDQSYRKFYFHYDKLDTDSQEAIKDLQQNIEALYNNKLAKELNSIWMKKVKEELSENWWFKPIDVKKQKDFYNTQVRDVDEKLFVIISDGLRYEVAEEINTRLNQANIGDSLIDAMQGVLPSYTQLGMASLLPHDNNLELLDNANVLIKSKKTNDCQARGLVLAQKEKNSLTITWEDLNHKGREARDLIKGKDLIYIYHNVIDDTGDGGKLTEHKIFSATNECIEEILGIITFVVNTLGAYRVLITADHGFIYSRTGIEEKDKIEIKGHEFIKDKHRFLIADTKPDLTGTIAISSNGLINNPDLQIVVPIGFDRFKKSGSGYQYVHGGASLQEITVPLIKFKRIKDDSRLKSNYVKLTLINQNRTVTQTTYNLSFIQSDPVNDLNKAAKYSVQFLADSKPHSEELSDKVTIMANSDSESVQDRVQEVKLRFNSNVHGKKEAFLKICNEEKDNKEEYISFKLKLGIEPIDF